MDAILNTFIMARTGVMERLLGARKKFNDLVLAVIPHRRTTAEFPRSGEPTETKELVVDLPHDITTAGCPRIREPTETTELMIMLMDLPHDILLDILTKLPSSSLCWIRGVSMTLLNIIDNPSFATLYTSRSLNSAASYAAVVGVPQIMLLSNYYTWFLQDSKTYRLITLQSLKYDVDKNRLTRSGLCNARFCSSSRWYGCEVEFVFCNLIFIGLRGPRPYQCYLVNPVRGECLELPIIHDNVLGDRKSWFGMGFDNMTTSHKIVCISQSATNRGILIAYVYTLEGARSLSPTSWRQIQSVPPYTLSTDNVSAYGHMYWGAYDHGEYRIVSFDFKKEEFFLTLAPKLAHRYLRGACLLNFKGCLALASSHSFTVKLWVLKDHENDEWELVYQIPSNLFSGIPRFERLIVICGEWEHGLFFKETGSLIFHFWDARDNSMIYMETLFLSNSNSNRQLWTEDGGPLHISFFSYTHSPISLKNYGNLCEREVSKSAFCDRNAETSTWYFE